MIDIPSRDLRPTGVAAARDHQRDAALRRDLQALQSLAALESDWDTYGAEPPNSTALRPARDALRRLHQVACLPDTIVPSVEGGVAFSFVHGRKHADIEFTNDGEVFVITSTSADDVVVQEFALAELEEAVRSACVYLGRQ